MSQPIVFPNNIRAIRERKKMLMKDLAEKLGVSLSSMSKIEKGIRKPNNMQIDQIAENLKVRRDDILVPLNSRDNKKSAGWLQAQRDAYLAAIRTGAAATAWVMSDLRKKKQLTLRDVATKLGLTLTVYHRVEMASRLLRPEELARAASLFGMKGPELERMIEKKANEQAKAVKNGASPDALLPRLPKPLAAGAGADVARSPQRTGRWAGPPADRDEPSHSPADALLTQVNETAGAAAAPAGKVIPIYGEAHHGKFVIDTGRAVGHLSFSGIPEAAECEFAVRVQSGRLGPFMRAGSLCFVQEGVVPAVGDTVLLVMKDKTAAPALYTLGEGQVPTYKMFWPDETLPMDHPEIQHIFKVRAAVFA